MFLWEQCMNKVVIILTFLVATSSLAHAKDIVVDDPSVYKKTVDRVATTLDTFDTEYKAWIFKSSHNGLRDYKHKNRSRDNVLIAPKAVPPVADMPITLIVWNHGLGGFSSATFERVMKQFDNVWHNTDNYVLAVLIPEMPWSVNTRTPRSRQGAVWKRKGSFRGIVTEAAEILNSRWRKPSYNLSRGLEVIVVGHSAGGSAIASASVEGSMCDLGSDEHYISGVVWSDASYGWWLQRAYGKRGCLSKTPTINHIVTRRWDTPHRKAMEFEKRVSKKTSFFWYFRFLTLPRKEYTHTGIGNRVLLLLQAELFPEGC